MTFYNTAEPALREVYTGDEHVSYVKAAPLLPAPAAAARAPSVSAASAAPGVFEMQLGFIGGALHGAHRAHSASLPHAPRAPAPRHPPTPPTPPTPLPHPAPTRGRQAWGHRCDKRR